MRLLYRKDLRTEKGIGYSRQHLYRKVKDGEFPRPIKPGISKYASNAWIETEIDEWLKQRVDERKLPPPDAA
jgi:prophage regulatory protein